MVDKDFHRLREKKLRIVAETAHVSHNSKKLEIVDATILTQQSRSVIVEFAAVHNSVPWKPSVSLLKY